MAFDVVIADLYTHGAPESYFTGVSNDDRTKALAASKGKCARLLSPRVGGPITSWTFTDPTGEEECTRDIVIVASADLAMTHGLTLPGEGADPQWIKRAEMVTAEWSRMGTVGQRPAAPLYAGLTDATPNVSEGLAIGWATLPSQVNEEVEA